MWAPDYNWLACVLTACVQSVTVRRDHHHAGGASAAHTALFIFAVGLPIWNSVPTVLRCARMLVLLHDHKLVCRVPHPQGKGRRAVQESCHPGFSHYNILCSSSTKPRSTSHLKSSPSWCSIGCSCFLVFPSSQGCCDSTFWTRLASATLQLEIGTWWQLCVSGEYCGNSFFLCSNLECCLVCLLQWFEVLDGLLGPYWKAAGLTFNCTFLLFGAVIQLIACARWAECTFYQKTQLSVCPSFLVLSAAGADNGSGEFWGELKLPSSFIHGRRKICSIKSNPMSKTMENTLNKRQICSVVGSIIPCQKWWEMDQLEWNHAT